MPKTTPPIDFDLSTFTPYRMSIAAQKLSEGWAREYRARFDISIPEWRVLAHLSQSNGVSVRDIEHRVAMEKSKVSRAAARLEEAGFIAKTTNDQDRRLVHLALTESGKTLMAQLLPIALAYDRALTEALGDTKAGLTAALDKLLSD